jgi:hypothetical protein
VLHPRLEVRAEEQLHGLDHAITLGRVSRPRWK